MKIIDEILEFLKGEKYLIKKLPLIEGTKTEKRYSAIAEEFNEVVAMIEIDKIENAEELIGLMSNRIERLYFEYRLKSEYLVYIKILTLIESIEYISE